MGTSSRSLLYVYGLMQFIAFILFLLYIGQTAIRLSRRSLSEWLIVSFILFTGSVILTGFYLSALYLIANTTAWAISVFITAIVFRVILSSLIPCTPWSLSTLVRERKQTLFDWFQSLPSFLKLVFSALLSSLFIIGLTNLLLVLLTVPNEWDSMTGHLNRVVQYIQRGTMRHFGGTNWNIDTYPKSVCTLQIYSYLITGKFENAFKLIHHLSFWMTSVTVFGITQRISQNLTAALFCACCYVLLPDVLMQAITTETDIVLAAYVGCLLYFLFTYFKTRDNRYFYFSGMAFGIAYGHKITFTLLLPSIAVLIVYTVFQAPGIRVFIRRISLLAASISISICLFTLPTGYLKNIQLFGHPIGPPTALKHQSIERAGSVKNLLIQGTRNMMRYGYDHVNLDGLRNAQWGQEINILLRKPLVILENKLKLRLDEETDFSIIPFQFNRRFEYYNANPYWGIIGFGLIMPLVTLTLIGIIKSRVYFFLAIAFALHFAALSYSAPYDPFKGRYFIETGFLGILFLGLLFTNQPINIFHPGRIGWKIYISFITLIGCISGFMVVFLNERALPFPAYGRPSAFTNERMHQMMMFRPDSYTPYKRFDELVPEDATVALGTINDDFEYPLYGSRLSRRLIPINPFEKGVQPIPKEADYLFFSKNVIKPQPGDIRLGTDPTVPGIIVPGEDYYLRKLK